MTNDKIRQLVKINEAGLVADAVNFDMIAKEQENRRLCQGFVFNYNSKAPKSSTVGVLDALRQSYHSPTQPNVHLLVQDYGKGKSHFGLVVANFFQQPYHSPEVKGILKQLRIATSNTKHGDAVLASLSGYKKRSKKHLVICLTGEQVDLKKLFLSQLRQALEAEGITDSIAAQLCDRPRQYLEQLQGIHLQKAEQYLESIGNPNGDVKHLINCLKEDNYKIIPKVIDISRQLTGGYAIDFEADLNIEAILTEIINKHCTRENRSFEGILILLDELNAYLQSWAVNSAEVGGMFLQNITNACSNHKGKIALLSFTQIRPSNAAAIPSHSREIKTYQKLTSRLELSPSTYEPISSLELVLSNLINPQSEAVWQQFCQQWNDTLLAESRDAYEKRITIYRSRNWPFPEFHKHLALNCFPLHPLTAYLLCNLDFTQGRTAIQFMKEDVQTFIQKEPVEAKGKLNYIYPVKLVDAFETNFSNYPIYKDYQKAKNLVAASASGEEITVLKGIFLFYASGNKLSKLDRESHEDILRILTGISSLKIKKALDILSQTRRVIYKLPNNTYGFYSGVSIVDLEGQIEAEVGHKKYSREDVLAYCRNRIEKYLNAKKVIARLFVTRNKLLEEDWQFQRQIYTISELERIINSQSLTKNISEKGLFAYAIAATEAELNELRDRIDSLLLNSPIRLQLAVAIPRVGTTDVGHTLQKLHQLNQKSSNERQTLGQAFLQLAEQYQQQIDKTLKEVFQSCTYHCSAMAKIPDFERENPQRLVSAVLEELYPFVPPVERNDKMQLKSKSGASIIGFASKHLLADDLTPQILPNKSYGNVLDPIFVSQWGLLKKSSQKYSLTPPTHEKVRAAWDEISQMTELNGKPEKSVYLRDIWHLLCAPPYGYNELTFTILLAAWLGHHRSEVVLKGDFGIPERKSDRVPPTNQASERMGEED